MTAHRDLSGAELHEPKGIEDASTGQVYVADGSGAGTWTSFDLSIPVGSITEYAGASAPAGWLFAFGQDVSRTTYADLFTAIGVTYGIGNGTTTFTLPDCRGRVTAGKDDMGGTSANRLTNQTGGLNGDTLGGTGGAETHALTTAQMPAHTHTFSATTSTDGAHTHTYQEPDSATTRDSSGGTGVWQDDTSGSTTSSNGAHTHTVSGTSGSTGSTTAHNNVQPTIVFNKIIYTGVT